MLVNGNHCHYELSVIDKFRKSNMNYIGTYERKKALLSNGKKLKNFDLIVNSKKTYITDIKGKQFSYPGAVKNNWENWLIKDHVTDLLAWKRQFKCNVEPLLIFVFKLSSKEESNNFIDIYKYKGVTYGIVAIPPQIYLKHSKSRARNVINVSRKTFKKIVKPLSYYMPEFQG